MVAKEPEFRRYPINLPPKTTDTVKFAHRDHPNDESQELDVIRSISAEDLKRLEDLGYVRKGSKRSDDEPKKAPPRKATA